MPAVCFIPSRLRKEGEDARFVYVPETTVTCDSRVRMRLRSFCSGYD